MNTVTYMVWEYLSSIIAKTNEHRLLIHGKRILIHYYCKDKWTQWLIHGKRILIIIVKQMNTVTNTWYENTYPIIQMNTVLMHGEYLSSIIAKQMNTDTNTW